MKDAHVKKGFEIEGVPEGRREEREMSGAKPHSADARLDSKIYGARNGNRRDVPRKR
jgi:hypothetical protein